MKKLRQIINEYYIKIKDKQVKLCDKAEHIVANQVDINQQTYTLEIARPRHADVLVDLQKQCYSDDAIWPHQLIVNELTLNHNCVYILVSHQTRPVAFVGAWIKDRECHISNVLTIPSYQNQGIGTYLLDLVEQTAIDNDCLSYTLEVRVSNKKAQRLYQRIGFVPTRVKYQYYSNDLEDAIEMTKTLARGKSNGISAAEQ